MAKKKVYDSTTTVTPIKMVQRLNFTIRYKIAISIFDYCPGIPLNLVTIYDMYSQPRISVEC